TPPTRRRLSPFQLPRRPHGTAEPAVGLVVADELLLLRVPPQLLAAAQRDDAEVTDGHRAVADLDVADRLLAAADAVEKVAHVVGGVVQPHGVGGQRLLEQPGVAGLDDVAVDEDPLVPLADEEHAVVVALAVLAVLRIQRTFPLAAAAEQAGAGG